MSLRDFEFLDKLGEGAFSMVWKVKRVHSHSLYALKKVQMNSLNEKEKRNALNEVQLLSRVSHPNVISYKEGFFDKESGSLCLLMEFASGGDLYKKVQAHKRARTFFSEEFLWDLLASLCSALCSLHELNIMHRDLKSANVFLTAEGRIKLGDLNVAKVAEEGMVHTQTGTPYYASPEVWRDAPYGTKSDIWSLGCVLHEAAALKPPFTAEDMQGLFRQVVKGQFARIPVRYSDELHSVIAQMIQVDPRSRPSCSQVLQLPVVVRRTRGPHKRFESKSAYQWSSTVNSHKQIMRDHYGALQLPKLKYPPRQSVPKSRVQPAWWG